MGFCVTACGEERHVPSVSEWITSTNCASVGSSLSLGGFPRYKGPAGSRPARQNQARGVLLVVKRRRDGRGGGLTRDPAQRAAEQLPHEARDVRAQAHPDHVEGGERCSSNLRLNKGLLVADFWHGKGIKKI